MYVHLLGTVELSARGEPLSIGSRKVRTLLACLAIDPERPVSPDTLAERLWDGEPPPSAAGTLQVYISRLRSALRKANETAGSADGPPVESISRSGTYVLRAETDQVDWQLFHRLAVQARSLVEVGDDRGALAALDRASDIWQGEPLAGLPGLWAAQMRSLMKGRRFAASVTRCEIELRFGRYADLVPDLAELADEQPWNEQVAAQLMTALYGCGRIAEALAAYRRIRRRLRDDLATEPDETLNRLHERMLRRELLDHTVPPQRTIISAPPSAPAPSRRPTTLPPAPELVGRDRELDLLVAAARGEWPMSPNARPASLPVVAVSGMPGCGKTALALAAAHRLHESFEDGAVLLRLGAHSGEQEDRGPESAATALLRQFGIPSSEIPVEPDELLAHCRELLAQRHAVVVLDDAAGPDQIGPLLPAAPTSFILITSRRRMAELPTVSTIPLNALTPQAATDMFTRLVGPARTTDPARVTDITRLCARHPLALHIAAGRFRGRPSWTLDHLAERLSRRNGRLDELRDSHGGIDRSFAMSYQALDAGHQLALHRLSLHPGDGFGAYLGAALIGCPPTGQSG
ncbi:BTAD domain-containing putative transcriptional regulator [Kitasatospora sp. NPDC051984]|uniref:AfsR/SARP family transcriptional regulator n=1 Tax=Kitasatospora sp. NPDC051984 TaxID=3364059 RepID=UPI0037C796B3